MTDHELRFLTSLVVATFLLGVVVGMLVAGLLAPDDPTSCRMADDGNVACTDIGTMVLVGHGLCHPGENGSAYEALMDLEDMPAIEQKLAMGAWDRTADVLRFFAVPIVGILGLVACWLSLPWLAWRDHEKSPRSG